MIRPSVILAASALASVTLALPAGAYYRNVEIEHRSRRVIWDEALQNNSVRINEVERDVGRQDRKRTIQQSRTASGKTVQQFTDEERADSTAEQNRLRLIQRQIQKIQDGQSQHWRSVYRGRTAQQIRLDLMMKKALEQTNTVERRALRKQLRLQNDAENDS